MSQVAEGEVGINMADTLQKKSLIKQAVALDYDQENNAPTVVASGTGTIAERIIEKAIENDVPIHKDSKLSSSLLSLEIGDAIPRELYAAVAEILVFVDAIDKKKERIATHHEQKGNRRGV